MTFQEFRLTFKTYPVFSIVEIEKLFPSFDKKNLVNWQKKNYIKKIRNLWYRFTETTLNEDVLFFTSNQIYQPSYISLESALSYYGFIPEGVFKTTAISTLKTQEFTTPIGVFGYQNLKSNLFFGYRIVNFGTFSYKIAEPEKAILDYLYLHSAVETADHFYELRLNTFEINQQINGDILKNYAFHIQSKSLTKRVETFLKYINNA
jgi:predicted transcriptional regulator of viral defense system